MVLGDVKGSQAAVPLAIDLIKLPGDVEGLAVLGESQAPSRTIESGGEVLNDLSAVDVVGQDVGTTTSCPQATPSIWAVGKGAAVYGGSWDDWPVGSESRPAAPELSPAS